MPTPTFHSGQNNFSGFVTVCGGVTPEGVNVPLLVDSAGRLITNIKTLAESRGVKRVWAQMNSFFFDPAAVSSATDNHLYSGQGLRPGSPDPTHETRK